MPRNLETPNKRRQQGARSRAEILDAAERMMSTRGFDGTSVADIARESGLPNSSIYWHFNSKAGILAAVMERGAERFFAAVAATALLPGETPGSYLRRSLRRASAVFIEQPEFWRLFVMLALTNDDAGIAEIVRRVRARGRDNLHLLVATAYGAAGPERAQRVADALADFTLAGFDGAFLALQANPDSSWEPLMEQLADSVAHLAEGVLADPGPRPAPTLAP